MVASAPRSSHRSSDGGSSRTATTTKTNSSINNTTKTTEHDDTSSDATQRAGDEARRDAQQLRMWRWAVAAALLLVAAAVSGVSYRFLADDQHSEFKNSFDQYAHAIGDAAVARHHTLGAAYRGFRSSISTYVASTNNDEWPLVTIPYFRTNAGAVLQQSNTEALCLMHVVDHDDRVAWENFTVLEHQAMVSEAHMLQNGNLEALDETGFRSYISVPSGTAGAYVPDEEREQYFPVWESAPAPATYEQLNVNSLATPALQMHVGPLLTLKDQVIFAKVHPYDDGVLHSELAAGSAAQSPRTSFYVAVQERVEDPDSRVVAILSGMLSWDTLLVDLLPDNVKGLVAVIKNTCGQAHTYEMDGKAATFIGDGEWQLR
mmetsp:Transcript_2283/g.5950  ORF Transcript_2283/g.5950 Transcript_2283/m.5950 type:complete len:375 (-) Transcript_2283:2345-3469(-)